MRAPAAPAIVAAGLGKRFASVTALDGLGLEVAAGEIVGLVGPDGSGKTTALRLLAGIMRPSEGSVRVLGTDVARDAGAGRAAVGYVPQASRTYADLTVTQNLHFFADLYGVRAAVRGERVAQLLEWSRLGAAPDRLARHLSGGMRQKLAVACAVVHRPRVLLLDEPTTGVDPGSRRDLWEIFYELLREGVAILVATPYLDEAERCHRVAFLHGGRVIALDEPRRLRAELPATVLEVAIADPFAALPAVRAVAGVADAYLFGETVHVLVPRDAAPAIAASLAAAGAPPRVVPPRLEDVFVFRLTRAHDDDAEHRGD